MPARIHQTLMTPELTVGLEALVRIAIDYVKPKQSQQTEHRYDDQKPEAGLPRD
jgi:hypothetical protein